MSEIKWVETPPVDNRYGTGRGVRQRALTMLRENPGQWALVRHYESYQSASATVAFFKRNGCEATQRSADDGGADVYARYMNDDGGAA